MAAKTTPRASARKSRTAKPALSRRPRAAASSPAGGSRKRASSRAVTTGSMSASRKKRSTAAIPSRSKVVKTGKKVMHEERSRIGALAGGSTGAMIGAVVGPIGAAVGAAIGAVAGSLADSIDRAGREKSNSNGASRKPSRISDTRKKQ